MSFQIYKSDSYCVGGRHRNATENIYGDITSKGIKVLNGYCSVCNRKKSMTIRDNTRKKESLGDFFENLGKKGLNVSKRWQKTFKKNPGRALDLTAKKVKAAVSRNSKQALSTLPELITFYNVGKGLFLGKFV